MKKYDIVYHKKDLGKLYLIYNGTNMGLQCNTCGKAWRNSLIRSGERVKNTILILPKEWSTTLENRKKHTKYMNI